jgi:GntR family transcriptional regulator, transcriptional repressor for pyruvate dehydrogenase complex
MRPGRREPVVARREHEPDSVRFERLEQQRAHEYVAEQIRRQIVLRLIPSGQALPPERDLAAMFGVGRATVQQAIRLLVDDRMVESRRGRHGGGNFVVGPDENRAGIDLLLGRLRRRRDHVKDALAYRRAVEPAVAAVAAGVRSQTDIRTLAHINAAAAAAETDVEFMQADTEFHFALAEASRNRLFREAIEKIRLELNDAMIALPESPVWHERSAREHEAILQAVRERDREAAATAMETHIAHTQQSVEALLAALGRRPAKAGSSRG